MVLDLFARPISVLLLVFAVVCQGRAYADSSKLNFSVLTLNTFCGETEVDLTRIDEQVVRVRRLNPEIACLQEVFDDRVLLAYRHAFPQYEFFYNPEKTQGTFNYHVFNEVFGSENSSYNVFGYQMGRVIMVRKSFARSIKHYSVQLPSAPPSLKFKVLEDGKPRGFEYIELEILKTGDKLGIANATFSNGVHNSDRIIQSVAISKFLETESRGKYPLILCGDMNADGEEPEMKWLRESSGFADSFLIANPDLNRAKHGGNTWDNRNELTDGNTIEPDQRLDYIYAKNSDGEQLETLSSKIVLDEKPYVSDHYGVYSVFSLRGR